MSRCQVSDWNHVPKVKRWSLSDWNHIPKVKRWNLSDHVTLSSLGLNLDVVEHRFLTSGGWEDMNHRAKYKWKNIYYCSCFMLIFSVSFKSSCNTHFSPLRPLLGNKVSLVVIPSYDCLTQTAISEFLIELPFYEMALSLEISHQDLQWHWQLKRSKNTELKQHFGTQNPVIVEHKILWLWNTVFSDCGTRVFVMRICHKKLHNDTTAGFFYYNFIAWSICSRCSTQSTSVGSHILQEMGKLLIVIGNATGCFRMKLSDERLQPLFKYLTLQEG